MKSIKKLIYYLLVSLLFVNCDNKEETIEPEFKLNTADTLVDNEYQIYSLILKEQYQEITDFVIKQRTYSLNSFSLNESTVEFIQTEVPDMDTSIFAKAIDINKLTFYLDNKFNVPNKSITLISDQEIAYLLGDKSWDGFYNKYPDSKGMISFTRVGFNQDMTEAILEIGHSYESLGADGTLIYLTKDNNGWKIIKTINTWVS